MSDESSNASTNGTFFKFACWTAFVVFFALKVANAIDWPWWVVFMPLIIWLIVIVAVFGFVAAVLSFISKFL